MQQQKLTIDIVYTTMLHDRNQKEKHYMLWDSFYMKFWNRKKISYSNWSQTSGCLGTRLAGWHEDRH